MLDLDGDPTAPKHVIDLVPAQVGFSSRVYARCPQECDRSVRKLYLMNGKLEFACRRCGGFQFESAQTHDARVDQCRRDAEAFLDSRAHLRTTRSRLVGARTLLEGE